MRKFIIRFVLLLAVAVVAMSCDDDNNTPTGPSTTVTQTGAFAPQPLPPGPFPFPPPSSPAAPNSPPAPNHPIFGDVNAVSGVCPVIRLTVSGRVVITERSTVFVLACRAILPKRFVRISGRFTPAGTMIASVVEPTPR
jgi:hypothetical protein